MSLADFMQELQTQDNIIYSQPPEPTIRIIPPEKVYTQIIPEDATKKSPAVIKLKIKQKSITTEVVDDRIHVEPPVQQSRLVETVKPNPPPMVKPEPVRQEPAMSQPKPLVEQVKSPTAQAAHPTIQKPPERPTAPVQQRPVVPVQQRSAMPTQQRPTAPAQQQSAMSSQQRPVASVQRPIASVQPTIVQQPVSLQKPSILTDDEIFVKSGTESSKYQIWIEYFTKAKASKKSNPIVDRMKVGRFTITPDNKVLLLPDYDIVGKDPDDVLKDKWF